MCRNREARVCTLDIKAYTLGIAPNSRGREFVEVVPTTRSLQPAYKRQMLNSFYLRRVLDISPRPSVTVSKSPETLSCEELLASKREASQCSVLLLEVIP